MVTGKPGRIYLPQVNAMNLKYGKNITKTFQRAAWYSPHNTLIVCFDLSISHYLYNALDAISHGYDAHKNKKIESLKGALTESELVTCRKSHDATAKSPKKNSDLVRPPGRLRDNRPWTASK